MDMTFSVTGSVRVGFNAGNGVDFGFDAGGIVPEPQTSGTPYGSAIVVFSDYAPVSTPYGTATLVEE